MTVLEHPGVAIAEQKYKGFRVIYEYPFILFMIF